jgi:hypothetical protein
VTPAQIRRMLAAAEADCERLRVELATALKEAELFRELLRLHGQQSEALHNQHESARINTMDTQTVVRGARLGTKHPGAVRIRAVDGSIAKFAAKHGLFATTVRSWYATGDAAREIPRRWADLLAKDPYKIPRSTWRAIGE